MSLRTPTTEARSGASSWCPMAQGAGLLGLLLLLGPLASGFDPGFDPGFGPELDTALDDEGDPAASARKFQTPGMGYHDHAAMAQLVGDWIRTDPRVERLNLGTSPSGREVVAFRFGSRGAENQVALEGAASEGRARRTVLLLGGLDGRSQAGSEAVLWSAHGLLGQLDHLAPDLSFVVVPWASPDALERTHRGILRSGQSSTRVDEDRDGLFEEDGPDDLDGDGLVLDMALADPEHGRWCFSEDHRFLVLARPGDAPRYSLTTEGRDDDLDGRFNEDPVGGINYNAQFPHGFGAPGARGGQGPWPLSESVPRRIAELCRGEPLALCISFVGSHGGVRFARGLKKPGGDPSGATVASGAERRIQLGFERTTGRRLSSLPKDSAEGPSGRAIDWVASMFGCVAMEVAVWGPGVVGTDGRPYVQRARSVLAEAGRAVDRSRGAMEAGRPLGEIDAAWAYWLDEIQGGAGFQDWHPVDLGQGRVGWVGGWEPRTRFNPPRAALKGALEGVPRFVAEVSLGLPRVELEIAKAERHGDLVQIEARAVNRGGLGTDLVIGPESGRVEVTLEGVGQGGIVAGPPSVSVDRLGPGESTPVMRWLVQSRPGATIKLRVTSRTAGTVVREIRP